MNAITSEEITQYVAEDNLLADKTILITGAGDGIGRTAAITFAHYGATVILLGRTMAKLEKVYDEIESAGGPQPAIFPMNFEGSTEHDYDALREVLATEFEYLDGILHNAGELGPRTPIKNYPLEQWNKLFQVNVTAPFALTKSLMPILEKAPSASIVFTSSGVASKGCAYWGAYAASKAAADNLMETLADELEGTCKVRVNSISPGGVRTRMRASAFPAEDPITVPEPKEIMNRYLFLMGKDSENISGQRFNAQP